MDCVDRQGWRKLTRALFCGLTAVGVLAVAVPTSALARPGQLDPAFGVQGKAVSALDFYGPPKFFYMVDVHASVTPQRGVVVSGQGKVLRYLPNGKRDRSFGTDGLLRIESVEGHEFRLDDLIVDDRGRIVVVGVVLGNSGQQPAALMRFEPSGAPDPSFGGGDGIIVTGFGLQRPFPFEAGPTSIVDFSGIAVDPLGQISVAGSAVKGSAYCTYYESFVARLTSDGSLDPGFGSGGVVAEPDGTTAISSLALDRTGAPLFAGRNQGGCRGEGATGPALYRLQTDGSPDGAFGRAGQAMSGPDPVEIAVDRSGRVLVLGSGYLLRLLPSGALDSKFAHKGKASLPTSTGWASVAVTGDGSAVLSGTRTRGPDTPGGQVAIARLSSRGVADAGFGHGGFATTGRRGTTNLTGRQVVLDGKGHAIVAGSVRDDSLPTGEGLALFRYDL
jgi:uncharacterized delta-60 repeat protein